jgi:hypothetical protein
MNESLDIYQPEQLLDPSSAAANFEERRLTGNSKAWETFTGYRTSSGIPCWDKTKFPCVPKHTGYGYNPNFWCLCCCFLCPKKFEES